MPRSSTVRVEFTGEHDAYLYKYLAKYCPSKQGRRGRKPFQQLVDNVDQRWPWSVHHPWQSWRERYVRNADRFDMLIQRYQDKHGVQPAETTGKRKRAAEPLPVDEPGRSAKRVRTEAKKKEAEEEEEEEVRAVVATSSETRAETPVEKPPSASTPQTHARPDARPSSSTSATSDDTRQPIVDLEARATVEPPLSSPDRSATRTDEPRPSKLRKKRQRESPDAFASEPTSPQGIAGPSSQGPPTSSTPVSTTTYPRAPPRIVNSLHGKVLLNNKGHLPRTIPMDETEEEEEEEEEEKEEIEVSDEPEPKVQWPPIRHRTARDTKSSNPDAQVDAHHPFSQPPPRPEPKPERKPDQDIAAAQVRDVDVIQNGASRIQRVVLDSSGHAAEPSAKGPNFPAPRPSTASPFRPTYTTRPLAVPQASTITPQQLAQQAPVKIARHHPALTRIRRQSIPHDAKNGRQHKSVPSIDLVALSGASVSRSHSRSSGASAAARSPRWSAPTRTSTTAWVLDSDSGSGSGSPFGRTDDRARPLGSTSASTCLPSRSFLGVPPDAGASVTPSSALPPHAPDMPLTASHGLASLLAHMAANHGLALGMVEKVYRGVGSLREADEVLRGMREAAEGFGMREIERREGKGKGKARERVRASVGGRVKARAGKKWMGNGAGRRSVVASEEGGMPEYLPPETSRAAMWMRQASYAQRQRVEEEKAEEEEGRAVEEDLRVNDADEVCVHHHDFSRCADAHEDRRDGVIREPEQGAPVDRYVLAHERESKIGRRLFRKDTQRKFV